MLCSICFVDEGRVYKEGYEDSQPHSRRENKEVALTPQSMAGTIVGPWSWLELNFFFSLGL